MNIPQNFVVLAIFTVKQDADNNGGENRKKKFGSYGEILDI